MTDWSSLRHAYGAATNVPDLLAAAEQSAAQVGSAWDDAWGHLCHQGTVYSASYAAIPLLAALVARAPVHGYMPGLHLAGAILASNDGPESSVDVRSRYASEVAAMRDIAEATLPLAVSDTEFLHALETLAAFEDLGGWQRSLSQVADGEVPVQCPGCGDDLLLQLDEHPPRITGWDDDGGDAGTVTPSDPKPGSPDERLHFLAVTHGRMDVASMLRACFGTGRCPSCDSALLVPTSLA